MDRRRFIASLTALAAGGCRLCEPSDADRRASAAAADLALQAKRGYFDCAVAGGADGPVAAVSARGDSVCEDSLFEIASVSKVFTAAICARLHASGRLDIDRPVHGKATIRDLASHVSGYTDAWIARAGVFGGKWPFASDAEYETAAMAAPPTYERGAKCVYSCTNMIVLGFLLERELGMDLDEAARKFVWGPLGMDSTTWKNVSPDDRRLVTIYTHGPRPRGTKGDENARNFSRPLGNAGVFASFRDLRAFASDLLSRRAFEREYYELLFATMFEGGGRRRSFGWNMSPGALPVGWSSSAICHSGYTGQYLAVDPVRRAAAIVLTNLKSDDPAVRSASFEGRRRVAAFFG